MPDRQIQIGEVAERTGLSINTIRHYDQAGLVTPSARSQGGFRLYTEADVERLLLIRRMKPLGFSIDEMGELLAVSERLATAGRLPEPDRDALRARLITYRERAEQRGEQLAAELAWAAEFVARMDALVERR